MVSVPSQPYPSESGRQYAARVNVPIHSDNGSESSCVNSVRPIYTDDEADAPILSMKPFTFDAHIHMVNHEFYWGGSIADRKPNGQVDLPRLIEGGIDALFFSLLVTEESMADVMKRNKPFA